MESNLREILLVICKGPSIKDDCSRGRGLSSADILQTRGVLHMRMSALFGAKTSDFLKLIERLALTREEGSIFRDFYANVFIDGFQVYP